MRLRSGYLGKELPKVSRRRRRRPSPQMRLGLNHKRLRQSVGGLGRHGHVGHGGGVRDRRVGDGRSVSGVGDKRSVVALGRWKMGTE